jgi:Zn finger protein HypA/HybF involved in hydrogenase expression
VAKKLTQEEVITRFKQVHGDRYDYSKVEYKNNSTPVCIICHEHGEFWQTPDKHFFKHGCKQCQYSTIRLTQGEWIDKANLIHNNKYDYSKTIYINARTKVIIICPIHGEFEQLAGEHLRGKGCPKCVVSKQPLTKDEFLIRVKEIHGDKYDYSKVDFTKSSDKSTIICPIHGKFQQRISSHLRGNSCPKCKSSKNELKIKEWLTKNNIEFKEQKTFNDCVGKRNKLFKFDFYLPDYNLCIEYDGEQHYIPICFNNKSQEKAIEALVITKQNDQIKTQYCKENNIKLLRIPYWKQNNIEEILNGVLK